MGEITKPIHTADVNGRQIRYFRPPLSGPHQPWHAIDDLFRAMEMERKVRKGFIRDLQASDQWKGLAKTVATKDGIVLIAPHFMAQGFMGAAHDLGQLPEMFERDYTMGVVAAMDVITAGMTELEAFNYNIAAFRNSNRIEGPHPQLRPQDIIYMDRDGETLQ